MPLTHGAARIALAGALLLCSACTPLTLTSQDNGRAVQLHPGKSFKLVLQSGSAGGYRWEVTDLDRAVVKQGETLALVPDSKLGAPGAAKTLVMSFEAVAPGHTLLRLAYRPPLPQPDAAERTYTTDITVR